MRPATPLLKNNTPTIGIYDIDAVSASITNVIRFCYFDGEKACSDSLNYSEVIDAGMHSKVSFL